VYEDLVIYNLLATYSHELRDEVSMLIFKQRNNSFSSLETQNKPFGYLNKKPLTRIYMYDSEFISANMHIS
jgi:hypothetical protein